MESQEQKNEDKISLPLNLDNYRHSLTGIDLLKIYQDEVYGIIPPTIRSNLPVSEADPPFTKAAKALLSIPNNDNEVLSNSLKIAMDVQQRLQHLSRKLAQWNIRGDLQKEVDAINIKCKSLIAKLKNDRLIESEQRNNKTHEVINEREDGCYFEESLCLIM